MSSDASTGQSILEPQWTKHGRRMWHNDRRNDVHDRDRDRGWHESVPVDYPSAYDGARGRYHADGDCVLIVKFDVTPCGIQPFVITVLNLRDRPVEEQAYVRAQAQFGGGSA